MKQYLILFTLAIVLILSGCTAPDPWTEKEAEEELVVTLLSFPDQDKSYLQAAIAAADLGFRVDIMEVPQNQYEDKAKMMLLANSATDLIMLDSPNIASYASSGMLEPLDDYWLKDDFSDLTDSMQATVRWEGHTWAAPLNDATCLLFYNKAIFDNAGIQTAAGLADSWSLQRLLEVARELTLRDVDGSIVQYGLQPVMFTPDNAVEGMAFTQMLYLWWFGAEILNEEMTQASGYLDSPQGLQALEYYRELYVNSQVAPLHELQNGFVEGKLAMWVTGPWMLGTWRDSYPDFFEGGWGVMPLPHGLEHASPCGSWNIAMTAQAAHKPEAWKVIEALTGRRGMRIWCEGTGNLPARKSVAEEANFSHMQHAYTLAMEQLLRTSRPRPITPAYPAISQALVDCFNSVAFGEEPGAALHRAAQRIDQVLKNEADYHKDGGQGKP